jgi:ketosteroid isomerase-like protein
MSTRVVRGFADAITRGDAEAALAVCHPEIEFMSVLAVTGRRYLGHEGVREYFHDVATAWEEWRMEVHRVVEGPDGRIAISLTMHVRGRESGAVLSEHTGHVWTLKDGRLWRNEIYRDAEGALTAVGAAPA